MLIISADDPEDCNPVAAILLHWCQQNFPTRGTSKKAEEIAAAERMAAMDAYAWSLAAILNAKRIEAFPQLASDGGGVPGIMPSDIYHRLREIKNSWDRMTEATSRDAAQRKLAVDRFLTNDVERFILNVVHDEKVDKMEEDRHRAAVLAGKEEPTADDADWLRGLREKADEESRILREAAEAAEAAASAIPTS